jgi:excisionase family DNA binding protein
MPFMMTVSKAADVLAVAPPTIRKAIKNGTISAILVNRRYRISEKEILNFIARNMIHSDQQVSDFSSCFS